MGDPLKATYFVEAAVEASIYVEPRDPGLTLEELTGLGARFGVRPGAIRDAVATEADKVERPVRGRVRLKAGTMYTSVHVSTEGEQRNLEAYEKAARFVRTHLEEYGKDATSIRREQLSLLDKNTHAIDVELALMELERLVELSADTVTVTQLGVNYFRDFNGIGHRAPWRRSRPRFAEILAQVTEIIRLRRPVAASSATKPSSESTRVPMKRIFVSHAAQNKTLANKFVRLILEGGIGVHADEIFLSSRPGSIPAGKYFIPYIRDQLTDARLVISLITPKYRTRPFCVCELGAAWAFIQDGFIPILHNVSFGEMDGVLQGVQALTLSDSNGLNELRTRVVEALTLQERGFSRWEEERNEFLSGLTGFEATDAALADAREEVSATQETQAVSPRTPEPHAVVLRKIKALAASLRASENKKSTMPYISPSQAASFNMLLQEVRQAGRTTTISAMPTNVGGFGANFGTTATPLSDLIGALEMLAAELED